MFHLPPFYDDQAPADFRLRFDRRARPLSATIGMRRAAKHRGRRLAALAAAIAVPAMAAPGEWQGLDAITTMQAERAATAPMPFERPGESFPGSAFYYLEDAPRMAYAASDLASPLFDISGTGKAEAAQLVSTQDAGPAARAFFSSGTGIDRSRALQCLTAAVYYEAASETIGGQRAVAQVVLNRVAHPSYPASVCGVVFQGSERRTGCQFSFTCDGSLNRKPSVSAWDRARTVAQDALMGETYAPVGLATHYHTIWISPYWAPSLHPVGTIGAHRFYRWRGAAGTPGAFRQAYAGSEPFAAPAVRKSSELATEAADPVALARAFEKANPYVAAPAAAGPADKAVAAATGHKPDARRPAPSYSATVAERGGDRLFTADNLPQASGVKPEYANSGRWIAQPK